jgi:hypothetical protein
MIYTSNLLLSLFPAMRNRVKASEGLPEAPYPRTTGNRPPPDPLRLIDRRLLVADSPVAAATPFKGRKPKKRAVPQTQRGRCPDCGLSSGRHMFFCPAPGA